MQRRVKPRIRVEIPRRRVNPIMVRYSQKATLMARRDPLSPFNHLDAEEKKKRCPGAGTYPARLSAGSLGALVQDLAAEGVEAGNVREFSIHYGCHFFGLPPFGLQSLDFGHLVQTDDEPNSGGKV